MRTHTHFFHTHTNSQFILSFINLLRMVYHLSNNTVYHSYCNHSTIEHSAFYSTWVFENSFIDIMSRFKSIDRKSHLKNLSESSQFIFRKRLIESEYVEQKQSFSNVDDTDINYEEFEIDFVIWSKSSFHHEIFFFFC